MNPKTVKVSLELQVADDSLSGSACNGTGAERPFSGWLGLIRTIDQIVDEHEETPATVIDPEGDTWPPAS